MNSTTSSIPDTLKRQAAAKALDLVESRMVLGLGTGSTVAHFLDLLGIKLGQGALVDVVGVPTSLRTEREARQAGIPLVSLAEYPSLDLAVDGADEVSPELDLIKGMGGALLREKMVAQAAARFVVIADAGKSVSRLGTLSPLPVEVVDWGWSGHKAFLERQGAVVSVRRFEDGPPFKSDNGNLILDCGFPDGIPDPDALESALKKRAGVVETGLFLGLATEAILAGPGGLEIRRRPS
ncbi:MAG TPA: ribose 5-phosphate isomerase A [Longimicrobiales bacterium]|nr:ribose 5-phosphate isomerase A [Longimicrobiales bacterium]